MAGGLDLNDFDSADSKLIEKVIQVLKILGDGQELQMDEFKYRLAATVDDSFGLLYAANVTNTNNDITEERWFGLELSIKSFAKLCLDCPEDIIAEGIANITLNKITKGKWQK